MPRTLITITWSPVFRWGVYIGLCLPLRSRATLAARRPSVCPLASIRYQLGFKSDSRAVYVFDWFTSVVHRDLHQPKRRGGTQSGRVAGQQVVEPIQWTDPAADLEQGHRAPHHHVGTEPAVQCSRQLRHWEA